MLREVDNSFFNGHMEGLTTRVSYLADRLPWQRHTWGGKAFGHVIAGDIVSPNQTAPTVARILAWAKEL